MKDSTFFKLGATVFVLAVIGVFAFYTMIGYIVVHFLVKIW